MWLGAHMPTSGGVWKALERGVEVGCEIVQLFVKNNMQWFGKPFSQEALAAYANELAGQHFHAIFGHTGYLINLASPEGDNREKSLQSLVMELRLGADLGLPFLVLHPGAHLGAGEDVGLQRVVDGLDEVMRQTEALPVRIALENTAGQGSCLGYRIEHLAEVYQRVQKPERLAVCLDTAHFFAAGYDIRTPQGWDAAIDEVEKRIGLKEVVAFHLNDSKTDLNSRVDRHEHIGKGKIGEEAFRHVVNDARFRTVPGCLETPKSKDLSEDKVNLGVLKRMRVQ